MTPRPSELARNEGMRTPCGCGDSSSSPPVTTVASNYRLLNPQGRSGQLHRPLSRPTLRTAGQRYVPPQAWGIPVRAVPAPVVVAKVWRHCLLDRRLVVAGEAGGGTAASLTAIACGGGRLSHQRAAVVAVVVWLVGVHEGVPVWVWLLVLPAGGGRGQVGQPSAA